MSNILNRFLYLFFVYISVYICVGECSCSWRTLEVFRRLRVTGSCELSDRFLELNLNPLQEQKGLFAAESSLQAMCNIYKDKSADTIGDEIVLMS